MSLHAGSTGIFVVVCQHPAAPGRACWQAARGLRDSQLTTPTGRHCQQSVLPCRSCQQSVAWCRYCWRFCWWTPVLPAVYARSARLLALRHGVTETAGSLGGSSDCAGESHRPVRVLAAVYRWDILVT